MVATITPTPQDDATTSTEPAGHTGHQRLIILHAEHDCDETLVAFAKRVGEGDHVTLANLRPAIATTLPPSMIASELGMTVHLGALEWHDEHERQLDLVIAARSRLLDELGVSHEVVTETYHRSVLHRITARNLRRAMGRIAQRARADEIVVGPGAILESHQIR